MKTLFLSATLLIAQLTLSQAVASSCVEPAPYTDIPSGAKASRDEMLSAQRAMKAYDNAVKAYSDCLHDEGDNTDKANVAVDRLQHLAERFNVELHAFKERNRAS
jgi:hypothetical protein